jgi:hypothetical protein
MEYGVHWPIDVPTKLQEFKPLPDPPPLCRYRPPACASLIGTQVWPRPGLVQSNPASAIIQPQDSRYRVQTIPSCLVYTYVRDILPVPDIEHDRPRPSRILALEIISIHPLSNTCKLPVRSNLLHTVHTVCTTYAQRYGTRS